MFELVLLAPVDSVETLSEALDALDALSVSVEDADAQTPAEQALFGEPGMPPPKAGWERSRVVSLFSDEAGARDAASVLSAQDFFAGCQLVAIQAVPEQDWVRLTQSQFTPVEITPEFWIVPTWHEPPAQARQVIRLDPGLAFGTGTHPTTRMCLRWIAANGAPTLGTARASGDSLPLSPEKGSELVQGGPSLRSGMVGKSLGRVLDYGCGSGILAIGAAKFGASSIDAVDIDEAAVQSTLANAEANHVSLTTGLPDKAEGTYQTVLANILATPLKVLAPLLCARVAPGGVLVLAGILERQADELKAAYAPYCQLQVADQEDGWILMTARL
ncbi:MAG: 50S ribosomal protein L11 methyltransferase [Polaromonas sp.]|uniref:50S ribosomal protein L11 methyltransferase n=1 Tax=Polaromonas sp. TaxID=1869339 RepID=UPI00272F56E4|nr:50S ribosomal protein L11 methyltransferase [Polaromonas sp.]MDP2450838.1 50S ribosomal protein L11 methyltransferase [Polaromonas sp.]MDP3248103.1 50S ribosomal protein L11 methyltransferase [Polaromonas sp.]MDP3826896.1 50S ribosomal protein L11 methyltransferase [Polaromonas sp.]